MRKSSRTPSIVPHGEDQNVYLVLDDLGRLGRVWREADEHADLESVIRELLTGQYRNPIGVVGFNMFEGWSQDVSHDVAQELRRRCDLHGRDVPSDLQDFVDRHDAVDRSQLSLPMRLVCTMACDLCEDCGWVCEEHPGRPWEGPHACTCGAAGAPCPRCNVPTEGEVPRMPDGFEIEVDEERWRQPSGHFRP